MANGKYVLERQPKQVDVYRHPATASMYKHLNDISTALTNLRRTSQQNL